MKAKVSPVKMPEAEESSGGPSLLTQKPTTTQTTDVFMDEPQQRKNQMSCLLN